MRITRVARVRPLLMDLEKLQKSSIISWTMFCVCIAILYGSLFPFDFDFQIGSSRIKTFLGSWLLVESIGDILGNIVLFVPFGCVGVFLFPKLGRTWIFVLWLLVALGCQLLQLFLPSRDPSLFDLYGNAAGSTIGWLLAHRAAKQLVNGLEKTSYYLSFTLILPIFWLGYQLIPFVPSIDFQSYKDAIKPLVLTPVWSWQKFFLEMACWVTFLHCLNEHNQKVLKASHLLVGVFGILLLKIIIVTNVVFLYQAIGMLLAVCIFLGKDKKQLLSKNALITSLLVSWAINSLFPFEGRLENVEFGWLPFSGFLEGSMLHNTQALCQKVFVYGSVCWLFFIVSNRYWFKIFSVVVGLIIIEIIQLNLAHKTAEITDPILFVTLAFIVFKINWLGTTNKSEDAVKNFKPKCVTAGSGIKVSGHSLLSRDKKQVMLWVFGYCLLVILGIKILLTLPGVPYNIRELFRFNASGIDLLFFSLALLSLGWGAAWLGRILHRHSLPVLIAMVSLMGLSVFVYLLFWFGVTRESIMDVAGSSVFIHRVSEKAVLGQWGIETVRMLGAENLRVITDIFEPVIRFGALIGPLLAFSGIAFALMAAVIEGGNGAGYLFKRALFLLFCIFPWLYLCKVIAFDWSSTDNLNELIARDGKWGVGGGGYLYGLVLLISVLSAWLCYSLRRRGNQLVFTCMVIICAVPLGWLLLNWGLEDGVEKYGLMFSGVSFLLGPDRETYIGEGVLFLRWAAVQLFAVTGLAFGGWLYLKWSVRARETGQSVLMVCRHNICRSPIAEGILRFHLQKKGLYQNVMVDSAGTHASGFGRRVDERAKKVAKRNGINLKKSRPRKIKRQDFLKFDHILVMDQRNFQNLLQQCPIDCVEKLALIMSFAHEDLGVDVPDPYYGNVAGFEKVFHLLDEAVGGFVDDLIKTQNIVP